MNRVLTKSVRRRSGDRVVMRRSRAVIIMLSMLPYWGVKEMEPSNLLSVLLSYLPDLPSGDENGVNCSRDSLPSVYCCSVVPVSCPRATAPSSRSCRCWSPVMILLAFLPTCRSCSFQSSPSSRSCRLPPPVYWGGCSCLICVVFNSPACQSAAR